MTEEELFQKCVAAAEMFIAGYEGDEAQNLIDNDVFQAGIWAGIRGTMETYLELNIIKDVQI